MTFEQYAAEYTDLKRYYAKGWISYADYLADLITLNATYLEGAAQ